MDLFSFFFPEQAVASHLRRIAAQQREARYSSSLAIQQNDDISALRGDVRFLTMVLATILKRLSETQTMSLADVQDLLDEVDGLDGVADRGLEPGVLRGLLGVLKQDAETTADPGNEVFEKISEIHNRFRK